MQAPAFRPGLRVWRRIDSHRKGELSRIDREFLHMPHGITLSRDGVHVDVRIVVREDGLVSRRIESEQVNAPISEVEQLVLAVRIIGAADNSSR